MLSRRDFLVGSSATTVLAAATGCNTTKGAPQPPTTINHQPSTNNHQPIDPNRVALVSDIHIPLPWSEQKYRTGREYPWIIDTVKRHFAEILELNPLPANLISIGDMSIAFGEEREYAILRELLQPFYDCGIHITLGMGNHDIRASFAKSFPECAAQSLIPGRYVHKVETPYADFIMLDSLKEPDKRGSYKAVTGFGLGEEQTAWLKKLLPMLVKPTFLCAHHRIDATGLAKEIIRTPKVVGYLHGHHHHWINDSVFHGYGDHSRTLRSVGIGALAIDRDVGYAVMDLAPDAATLKIVAKDYYFPAKLPQDQRPRVWDAIVQDNQGLRVTFPIR